MAARKRDLINEALFLFTTSVTQFLDERFENDYVKAAIGWHAINDSISGPSTPGTAYILLHDHASEDTEGGARSWGFVRGGIGVVTEAMATAAREAGAEIRTGAEVERIMVEGGRAVGLALAGGERGPRRPGALQRRPEADLPRPARRGASCRPSSSPRSAPTAARGRA